MDVELYREFFFSGWVGSAWFRYLHIAHHMLGNYKQELKEVRKTQKYYPGRFYEDEARALTALGKLAELWDEAQFKMEELAQEYPDNIPYKGRLGTLAVRKGDREEAKRISEELKNIDRPYLRGIHTWWRACIASLLGEKDLAVSLLKESLSEGQNYGVGLLRNMDFEPLRDDKTFQELLKPKE